MADKVDVRKNPINLKLAQLGDFQLGLTGDGVGAVYEKKFSAEDQNKMLRDSLMRFFVSASARDGNKKAGFYFKKKF